MRNGGGRTVARVGDRLKMTLLAAGGVGDGLYIPECDARLHSPIVIRNFDLPVAFPRHDEGIGSVSYTEGRLELRNGCIYVGSKIAVWPSDYTMEETLTTRSGSWTRTGESLYSSDATTWKVRR